jgi:hypothetical protein
MFVVYVGDIQARHRDKIRPSDAGRRFLPERQGGRDRLVLAAARVRPDARSAAPILHTFARENRLHFSRPVA